MLVFGTRSAVSLYGVIFVAKMAEAHRDNDGNEPERAFL